MDFEVSNLKVKKNYRPFPRYDPTIKLNEKSINTETMATYLKNKLNWSSVGVLTTNCPKSKANSTCFGKTYTLNVSAD